MDSLVVLGCVVDVVLGAKTTGPTLHAVHALAVTLGAGQWLRRHLVITVTTFYLKIPQQIFLHTYAFIGT